MKKFINAYDAGYDAGLNGANEENCNPFKWFNKPENTKEWERGNKDGSDQRELDSKSVRERIRSTHKAMAKRK